MAEPEKKFAIIVADIEGDIITKAQFKITDVATEIPDTTRGYSPIDIKDLATPSVTAPVTPSGPVAAPVTPSGPVAAPEPIASTSKNSWPKELEPATYKSVEKPGIFYLVEVGEVKTAGENIRMVELIKKLSPYVSPELKAANDARKKAIKALQQKKAAYQKIEAEEKKATTSEEKKAAAAEKAAAEKEFKAADEEVQAAEEKEKAELALLKEPIKDYKKGIQELFFRKINVTRVATTVGRKLTRAYTKVVEVAYAKNEIPGEFVIYFELPEKGNIKFSPTAKTTTKPDSLLTVTGITSDKLEGKYEIYQAVDNKGFLSINELIKEDTTIPDADKELFADSLKTLSGGAKKLLKKNNLKTKNRRNKLSKRKSLKRITRKIRHT